MPVTAWIEKERQLIRATISGEFATADIMSVISKTIQHPDFRVGFNVLSEHANVAKHITPEQVRETSETLKQLSSYMAGARWAAVTQDPVSFGMMRMMSVYLEAVPIELRVFKDLAGAEAWISDSAGS